MHITQKAYNDFCKLYLHVLLPTQERCLPLFPYIILVPFQLPYYGFGYVVPNPHVYF